MVGEEVIIFLFFLDREKYKKHPSAFCKIIKLLPIIILFPESKLSSGSGSEAGKARMCLWTEHRQVPRPGPGRAGGRGLCFLDCQDVRDTGKRRKRVLGPGVGEGIFHAFRIALWTQTALR